MKLAKSNISTKPYLSFFFMFNFNDRYPLVRMSFSGRIFSSLNEIFSAKCKLCQIHIFLTKKNWKHS